ncbi:MAG: GAF domain-containing protein [Pseudomonadota bacterium]|nr:GAF domain-containing protein [Pseudomonadota bacterium]
MNTFIRVVEIWVPSNDRTYLEYSGGLHGSASRFGAASQARCFGRGEGLPGQAWEQEKPIVLKQFDGSYFQRTKAAHAEGLTCGIALPIFAGDFLMAVLVMFCGDDDAHAGAIELWHNDPAKTSDMNLVDGYYGSMSEAFELISRSVSFRRGNGLPGVAWELDGPVFMEDLGKGDRFLRADTAVKVGVNRGFAFPCATPKDEHYVMAFLSALGTPIARRCEFWEPDAEIPGLHCVGGFCEVEGRVDATPDMRLEAGQGTIGKLMLTGVPAVTEHAASEPAGIGASALRAGLTSLLAIPILRDGQLTAAVALYF